MAEQGNLIDGSKVRIGFSSSSLDQGMSSSSSENRGDRSSRRDDSRDRGSRSSGPSHTTAGSGSGSARGYARDRESNIPYDDYADDRDRDRGGGDRYIPGRGAAISGASGDYEGSGGPMSSGRSRDDRATRRLSDRDDMLPPMDQDNSRDMLMPSSSFNPRAAAGGGRSTGTGPRRGPYDSQQADIGIEDEYSGSRYPTQQQHKRGDMGANAGVNMSGSSGYSRYYNEDRGARENYSGGRGGGGYPNTAGYPEHVGAIDDDRYLPSTGAGGPKKRDYRDAALAGNPPYDNYGYDTAVGVPSTRRSSGGGGYDYDYNTNVRGGYDEMVPTSVKRRLTADGPDAAGVSGPGGYNDYPPITGGDYKRDSNRSSSMYSTNPASSDYHSPSFSSNNRSGGGDRRGGYPVVDAARGPPAGGGYDNIDIAVNYRSNASASGIDSRYNNYPPAATTNDFGGRGGGRGTRGGGRGRGSAGGGGGSYYATESSYDNYKY